MLLYKPSNLVLALFIAIASCKKDSDKKPIDLVRSSLTTSSHAYDSATADSWVKVTAEEYQKLLTSVTQAVTCGATEPFMNSSHTGGWNTNLTIGGNELLARVPASSYIIAWSVKLYPSSFSINASGSKLLVSSSQKTGYTSYGKALPDIGSILPGSRIYFVLKKPSTTTPPSPSYIGIYCSTSFYVATGPGGPEYYAFGETNSLGNTGIFSSSFSQVISTIKNPY